MDEITDKEYDQIMDIFASPGWKTIMRDIEEIYQNRNNLLDIQSLEDFLEVKGELKQLGWFMNLENWYQFAKDNQDADV